jgi:hypothetical protein
VFFPSLAAAAAIADEADRRGTPVVQAVEPRGEDAGVRARYERQMCLKLADLAKLGPDVVTSVAATASDPYLRVGTDIAILIQSKNMAQLRETLLKQMRDAAGSVPNATPVSGPAGEGTSDGFVSPDRAVSVYLTTLGDTVVVSNSLPQLQHIIDTQKGKSPAIAGLNEYAFFRSRYPSGTAGNVDESGFLFLSDPAIRRLCGPRWRIADSRRTRAAAVLADLQARRIAALADKSAAAAQPDLSIADKSVGGLPIPDLGTLNVSPSGAVTSSIYGSLAYMTPISELEMSSVSRYEAVVYEQWREGYQRNWTQFFDPIGVRFTMKEKRLGADMTVMPLIASTEYKSFIDLSRGVELTAASGDPHEGAIAHFILALNRESSLMKSTGNLLQNMAGVKLDPFGWVGKSVSIYADDDPFWDEMQKAKNADDFLEQNYARLPVAVHVESNSALKLTAFLVAVRAYVEQSSPGMVSWENVQHNGQSYVKVSPSAQAKRDGDLGNAHLYYVSTADALIVSLSEKVIQRAIDRLQARRDAKADAKPAADAKNPWLGSSFALKIDNKAWTLLRNGSSRASRDQMQRLAWSNIPILNEWHRLFPDRDPADVHAEQWHVRLVDPAGGKYVWNEQHRTMESTTYGHPGAPKDGPDGLSVIEDIARGNFGITFEESGLRARAEIERK